jgi:MtN3 and saliva related transmembrane protein
LDFTLRETLLFRNALAKPTGEKKRFGHNQTHMPLIDFIGTVAAVSTTTAFIPQIVKIRRQGGRDLSYSMLVLYLTGIVLWLLYGLMIHAAAVIWANAATSVLVAGALVLKFIHPHR